MKYVRVGAHSFDCLPQDAEIWTDACGYVLRVACERAVANILSDNRLRGRSPKRMSFVVYVISESEAKLP